MTPREFCIIASLLPFEMLTPLHPYADLSQIWRAALGGLLVGVGASMGNGCTSGHGICGNARLSVRCASFHRHQVELVAQLWCLDPSAVKQH